MSDSTFRLENYSKLYVRVKFLYLFCELFLDYWGNVWDKRETKEKKRLRRKDKVICRGCWRKKEPAYICYCVIFWRNVVNCQIVFGYKLVKILIDQSDWEKVLK